MSMEDCTAMRYKRLRLKVTTRSSSSCSRQAPTLMRKQECAATRYRRLHIGVTTKSFQRLLEKGADVNAQGGWYGNGLR